MGVFDKISDALSGRQPTQSATDSGTLNKKGYSPTPVPVPPSVAAARQKMLDGVQRAMGAHADLVHPVKSGGAS